MSCISILIFDFISCFVGPPSEVTFYITNVTHNSVAFNWLVGMDGNTNVTGVKLCCGDTGEDLNVANKGLCAFPADFQQTDKLSSSGTLFGLLPNKTNYCKIYAATKVGVTASRFLIIKTKPTGRLRRLNLNLCDFRWDSSKRAQRD